ncbi:branched-chain amino acid ABC transporter permease [Reyranella soli]|uniref:Amino acid ABC transporter permease n=1 Tax=Reyranella soli TaxID=1230389 RepID=A0A512NDE1_9HYPH|nr:branched-chain amino acid ABC transporter permease [Reyranella soli]GEP56969.1 amino acid ABC transporter permease [Reyranella soli]
MIQTTSSPSRAPLVALVVVGAILLLLPLVIADRPFELRMATLVLLFATMGQGWNVLGGYGGQISIGHGLYFGLGAYTSAVLSVKFGVNPWLGLPLAILVPTLYAVAIGIPCFRLRGHYFVIATLVVAESMFQVFTVWDWVGAAIGLELPVRPDGWLNFQFHRDKTPYYYLALGLLAVVTFGIWRMGQSRLGFLLRAVRDDEEALRSLGFSPQVYKSIAMAISAAILGAAGVFHTQYVLFVDPFSVLGLHLSVLVALFAILGGAGTLFGPILGAAILVPLSEYSRVAFSGSGRNVDLLIYGFLIMVIAVYRPDGVIGWLSRSAGSRRRAGASMKGQGQ